MGPTDAAGARELENPFGPRVERPMNRMAEPGQLAAGSVDRSGHLVGDRRGLGTGSDLLLRAFEQPVYFALGGRSNPDYYGQMAERARAIFPNFTLDVFDARHHFEPPHRIEPERTAQALRARWARADG